MQVKADLVFEVQPAVPRRRLLAATSAPGPVRGRVDADGSRVEVAFDRTPSPLGVRRRSASMIESLVDQGLTVVLRGPEGMLATVGAGVRAPAWQRVLTGSRYVRLGPVRVLRAALRGPRLFTVA